MIFRILVTIASLLLASHVAYASVFGFIALLPTVKYFAFSMGVTVEIAKLVSISYLYRDWKNDGIGFKSVLMSITLLAVIMSAIGVFGYISRAHIEGTSPLNNNVSRLVFIEDQIALNTKNLNSAQTQLASMDDEINKLIKFDKVSGKNGSKATRLAQTESRLALNEIIISSQRDITKFQAEKFEVSKEVNGLAVEMGAIRYLAEMLWEIDDVNKEDKAVRLWIILIMFMLDPFAIVLLIASNKLYVRQSNKVEAHNIIEEPVIEEPVIEDVIVEPAVPGNTEVVDKIDSLSDIVSTLANNVSKQHQDDALRNKIIQNIRKN